MPAQLINPNLKGGAPNFFLSLSNIDAHILPKYMNLTLSNIEDGMSVKEKLRTALYPLSRRNR
jgi:hypothetical protein